MSDAPHETIVIAPGRVLPAYLQEQTGPAEQSDKIQDSKWAVLAVLFLVTGAFGLPLLWRSDQFSALEKIIWATLVILFTIALIYLMVIMVRWSVGDALR